MLYHNQDKYYVLALNDSQGNTFVRWADLAPAARQRLLVAFVMTLKKPAFLVPSMLRDMPNS